jgi:hypothetical protein
MTSPHLDSETTVYNDPSVYRTLLESTRAIPWRIDSATMRFEPNVFLDRVDRRLYQAKSVGRDRICDV